MIKRRPENACPLWKEMGSLITWDMKKAEVINYLFPSVFTNKSSSLTVKIAEGKELENWENEEPHTVGDKI